MPMPGMPACTPQQGQGGGQCSALSGDGRNSCRFVCSTGTTRNNRSSHRARQLPPTAVAVLQPTWYAVTRVTHESLEVWHLHNRQQAWGRQKTGS